LFLKLMKKEKKKQERKQQTTTAKVGNEGQRLSLLPLQQLPAGSEKRAHVFFALINSRASSPSMAKISKEEEGTRESERSFSLSLPLKTEEEEEKTSTTQKR